MLIDEPCKALQWGSDKYIVGDQQYLCIKRSIHTTGIPRIKTNQDSFIMRDP